MLKRLIDKIKTVFDLYRMPALPCGGKGGRSFDEMAFFNKEVRPFLNRAAELCKQHKIPHLFWAVPLCEETESGQMCRRDSYIRSFTDNTLVSEVALFSMIATGELGMVDMANRIIAASKKQK